MFCLFGEFWRALRVRTDIEQKSREKAFAIAQAPARLSDISATINIPWRQLATFFDPSIYWQGLDKHLVDNAQSVGILRCSKNPVDARDKKYRQKAEYLSLAGASGDVA